MLAANGIIAAQGLMSSDIQAAHALFVEATEQNPTCARAWQGRACTAARLGHQQDACRAIGRALELADDVVSHCLRAEILLQQLEIQPAIAAVARCIELDPDAATPHGVRARVLLFALRNQVNKLTSKAA